MDIQSAPALLEDAAAAAPDRVWFEEVGAGSLTFGEAAREAVRWAAALRLTGTMANFLAQLPARADDAQNPVRELLTRTTSRSRPARWASSSCAPPCRRR